MLIRILFLGLIVGAGVLIFATDALGTVAPKLAPALDDFVTSYSERIASAFSTLQWVVLGLAIAIGIFAYSVFRRR